MSIHLREREKILFEAHLHWTTHIFSGAWAVLCTPAIMFGLGSVFYHGRGFLSIPAMVLFYYGPLIYTVMKNECKSYVLTNERVYVEEGILSKIKKDIPLNKINDLEVAQGVIQRMVHAGDILILTGNDKPTCLTNVAFADTFKNQIAAAIKK